MSDASPGLGSDGSTPEQSGGRSLPRRTRSHIRGVAWARSRAGTGAPGREAEWIRAVSDTLRTLEDAMSKERTESLRLDSLLSMIAIDNPRRFASRVRQLREQ